LPEDLIEKAIRTPEGRALGRRLDVRREKLQEMVFGRVDDVLEINPNPPRALALRPSSDLEVGERALARRPVIEVGGSMPLAERPVPEARRIPGTAGFVEGPPPSGPSGRVFRMPPDISGPSLPAGGVAGGPAAQSVEEWAGYVKQGKTALKKGAGPFKAFLKGVGRVAGPVAVLFTVWEILSLVAGETKDEEQASMLESLGFGPAMAAGLQMRQLQREAQFAGTAAGVAEQGRLAELESIVSPGELAEAMQLGLRG